MHYSRVRSDWTANQIRGIIHVNNNDLVLLPDLVSHTNKLVRLHSERVEANAPGLNAKTLELYCVDPNESPSHCVAMDRKEPHLDMLLKGNGQQLRHPFYRLKRA